MKRIIKLIAKAFIWAFRKDPKFFEPIIRELYQKIRKEEFKIKSEIVPVKKGKIKYKIAYFETMSGMIKFNMGRHYQKHKAVINT